MERFLGLSETKTKGQSPHPADFLHLLQSAEVFISSELPLRSSFVLRCLKIGQNIAALFEFSPEAAGPDLLLLN